MASRKDQVSKRELREQRRLEKIKAVKESELVQSRKRLVKKALFYGAIFLVLGSFIYSAYLSEVNKPAPSNVPLNIQQVHWHAFISDTAKHSDRGFVTICGEKKLLPEPVGRGHLGGGVMHTHATPENWIHLEGRVNVNEPPTVDEFFKQVGWTITSTQLLNKSNGDECENTGLPGQVRLVVNGEETNFNDYRVRDGDVIQVSFE